MRAVLLVIALAGCNVVFGFDDIQPSADASTDGSSAAPNVFSSPGPRRHSLGYDFAKAVTVTLAADDPTTIIYYTTDGTTPTLSSTHGTTPLTGVAIEATETLDYFGVTSSGQSAPVQDAYYVTTMAQGVAGYHVTDITLDGSSPVVVVSPGQVLTGASALVQVWVQTVCPSCGAQVVYGVDTTDQGCLFDDSSGPGEYPGNSHTATFTVTAPMTPGIHEVRITHSEQLDCAHAMAMNSLVSRPDQSRIGVLIVQ